MSEDVSSGSFGVMLVSSHRKLSGIPTACPEGVRDHPRRDDPDPDRAVDRIAHYSSDYYSPACQREHRRGHRMAGCAEGGGRKAAPEDEHRQAEQERHYIDLLCETYEMTDDEGRRLTRILAS